MENSNLCYSMIVFEAAWGGLEPVNPRTTDRKRIDIGS